MASWLNVTFYQFDYSIAKVFNALAQGGGAFLTPFADLLALLGKGGIFLLILSVALSLFKKTRRGGFCMLLAIGIGALFTNLLIKNLVARPRPYQASEEFRAFWEFVGAKTESEYSFPSGHMTVSTTSMMALFLCFNKKWSFLGFIYALFTGASRIYLGVHYCTDVIGGMIIGLIAGTLAYLVIRWLFNLLERKTEIKFCSSLLNFSKVNLFKNKENKE